MKKTLIIAQLFVCSTLFAQNLVSNPSFEVGETQPCPTIGNLSALNGWVNPTGNTPDWFFDCISGLIPVGLTNRYPHSGHAFIGLATLYSNNIQTSCDYMQEHLPTALKTKHHYYLEMYVVSAFSNSMNFGGCNGIGALLTTYAASAANTGRIIKRPQFFNRTIINDTSNWFKISGTFVADSAYQYLTLGNFLPKDSILTDTLYLPPSAQPGFVCYNFIDDISLIDLDSGKVSGITELGMKNEELKIAPNPTKDKLTVSGYQLSENTKVEVLDLLGRKQLANEQMSRLANEIQIDVSGLVSGIYFIKATDEKGFVRTGKFVKE